MHVDRITVTGIGAVALTEADVDLRPGPRDVLVAPEFVGICGSDIAVLQGHHPFAEPPVVTGHEVCAHVVQAGTEVDRLSTDDLVVLNPLLTCGHCDRCRDGVPNQCENAAVRGFGAPGAGVTRIVVHERELHRVPPGLPADVACLAEPLAAARHAAHRWDGLEDVAVVGAGGIGALTLLALRDRGAGRITVVEPDRGKREIAHRHGADEVYAPDEAPTGSRFTGVFDCVSRESTLDWAITVARPGGAVVTVGVPGGPTRVPLERSQRFEISLLGTGLYLPGDIDAAIGMLAAEPAAARDLITDVIGRDRVGQAYARAQNVESVKVLIAMS